MSDQIYVVSVTNQETSTPDDENRNMLSFTNYKIIE